MNKQKSVKNYLMELKCIANDIEYIVIKADHIVTRLQHIFKIMLPLVIYVLCSHDVSLYGGIF